MFRPLPVAMLAAFVSLVLAVADAHAQSRLWHVTIGAGYDMPEGDAGEVTDDDYSLVLGVTLTPEQQQLAYYADFQFAEYDLTQEVVDFFHLRFDRWGREAPLMIESTLRRIFLLTFSPALRARASRAS